MVALRALAVAPRLWQTYNTDDNLLFRRADFANPSASPLFRDLAALTAMRDVSQRLARICQEPYSRIPTLDEFLNVSHPTLSSNHVAVLNTLYAPQRPATRPETAKTKPHSWKLRRAAVQTTLAFSPDGLTLATGDRDGRITLRDSATGRTQPEHAAAAHRGSPASAGLHRAPANCSRRRSKVRI